MDACAGDVKEKLELGWQLVFVFFELLNHAYSSFNEFLAIAPTNYKDRVDVLEQKYRKLEKDVPAVDIWITTCNEAFAVVSRTLAAAKAVDYPVEKVRIFVLDDGRRGWLKKYCAKLGVNYLARPTSRGNKAGNHNDALAITRSMNPAPFILVLDADFCIHRNIIYRLIGFFEDQKVGIVGTPQYFNNGEAFVANLRANCMAVDDQRTFFDVIQPGKDRFDSAFFCGTSSMIRRSALEEIGGVPEETLAEDLYLSYKMYAAGYITRFHAEILSSGVAAETFSSYLGQRMRWCRGCLQGLWKPYGPFGFTRITMMQRLNLLSTMAYWVSQFFYPLFLLGPVLYWIFGIATLKTTGISEMCTHALPLMIVRCAYEIIFSGGRIVPWITNIGQVATSFHVSRCVIETLLFPNKKISWFVTSKEPSGNKKVFNLKLISGMLVLHAVSIFGLFVNQFPDMALIDNGGLQHSGINIVWSIYLAFTGVLTVMVAIDLPKPRQHDRFQIGEPAVLSCQGVRTDCQLVDMSMSGARIKLSAPLLKGLSDQMMIDIKNVGAIRAEPVRARGEDLMVKFTDFETKMEHRLRKLYTHGYYSSPTRVSTARYLSAITSRIME